MLKRTMKQTWEQKEYEAEFTTKDWVRFWFRIVWSDEDESYDAYIDWYFMYQWSLWEASAYCEWYAEWLDDRHLYINE